MANTGQRDVLATITPDTQITGDTTIYGQVVMVGGRDPKVMVEMVNGRTIYCDASLDIAKQLGKRLYSVVGLSGVAHWDAQSLFMERFMIRGVTPYEGAPLQTAMRELAKLAGPYYANVRDVQKHIAEIRGPGMASEPTPFPQGAEAAEVPAFGNIGELMTKITNTYPLTGAEVCATLEVGFIQAIRGKYPNLADAWKKIVESQEKENRA